MTDPLTTQQICDKLERMAKAVDRTDVFGDLAPHLRAAIARIEALEAPLRAFRAWHCPREACAICQQADAALSPTPSTTPPRV
jgi:hypothetical protein